MRTFNVAASEVVRTETGDGFRRCTLEITLDTDTNEILCAFPRREGDVEGAPQPDALG